jgi:GNAT superfamily N-acetyltransferase
VQAIPDAVRRLAEFPGTFGPEPPAGSPIERLRDGRFTALLTVGPSGQMFEALDLGDDVSAALEAARAIVRERGRDRAVWFVSPSSRPAGLLAQFLLHGLERAEEPPWEPTFASMALLEPPEPGPEDVVARPVASFEEYAEALRLDEAVFGLPEDDRRAWEKHRRELWELQVSGRSPMRVYAGYLDDELVGVGRSMRAESAVNLSGGSVAPKARGRGVYRALVRARWDDAVAWGTPALTVQAGRLSRPVLERLGFELIAEQHCLIDRFAGT